MSRWGNAVRGLLGPAKVSRHAFNDARGGRLSGEPRDQLDQAQIDQFESLNPKNCFHIFWTLKTGFFAGMRKDWREGCRWVVSLPRSGGGRFRWRPSASLDWWPIFRFAAEPRRIAIRLAAWGPKRLQGDSSGSLKTVLLADCARHLAWCRARRPASLPAVLRKVSIRPIGNLGSG